MFQTHIQEHIDVIAKHEQEFLSKRTRTERISDNVAAFVGSVPFVVGHIVIFCIWIAVNLWPRIHHFDPEPFPLLSTLVALEAILVASFILMRQTRLSHRADERDHLMLQILLLTERELTAVLRINTHVADKVGLDDEVDREEIHQLSQATSIDEVARTIKENLPVSE